MILLDGKKVKETKLKIIKERSIDYRFSVLVIQVGDDEASSIYIKQKEKVIQDLNCNFILKQYPNNIEEYILIEEIRKANHDNHIIAILIELPLPKHLNKEKILNTIDPKKDIDCLTQTNMSLLENNNSLILPCTPKGILILLNEYNISVKNKNIVILGRSNLVGKPLSILLKQAGAVVSVCHSKTENIKEITKKADILISAIGQKHFITEDMIKENVVIVDVGINREDNCIYGDVDFEQVKQKVSFITPVPGGVGPMTILAFADNLYQMLKEKEE